MGVSNEREIFHDAFRHMLEAMMPAGAVLCVMMLMYGYDIGMAEAKASAQTS